MVVGNGGEGPLRQLLSSQTRGQAPQGRLCSSLASSHLCRSPTRPLPEEEGAAEWDPLPKRM